MSSQKIRSRVMAVLVCAFALTLAGPVVMAQNGTGSSAITPTGSSQITPTAEPTPAPTLPDTGPGDGAGWLSTDGGASAPADGLARGAAVLAAVALVMTAGYRFGLGRLWTGGA